MKRIILLAILFLLSADTPDWDGGMADWTLDLNCDEPGPIFKLGTVVTQAGDIHRIEHCVNVDEFEARK